MTRSMASRAASGRPTCREHIGWRISCGLVRSASTAMAQWMLTCRSADISSRDGGANMERLLLISTQKQKRLLPGFDGGIFTMGLKRTYVLLHGAWHGGWVWRDVASGLRAMGHAVTTPTLTGLGERRHVGNDTADLATHIEDVVAHIEMEELQDITLVGWSYGGMVVTGALARIPHRIKSL